MATNFAWPICHRRKGEYTQLAGAIVKGMNYQQAAYWSTWTFDGLDLWLSGSTNAHKIFACFAGSIYVYTGDISGTNVDAIRLELDTSVRAGMVGLPTLEVAPHAIHYLNIDRAALRAELTTVISNAFTAAQTKGAKIHPILGHMGLVNATNKQKPRLIDNITEATLAVTTTQVLDNFFNNSATDPNARLPLLAGDSLGNAKVGSTPYSGSPLDDPRQLVLQVEELASYRPADYTASMPDLRGHVRDPMHDLWVWGRAVSQSQLAVEATAPLRDGTTLHPLLAALAIDPTGKARPEPRKQIAPPGASAIYTIPVLAHQRTYHQHEFKDPKNGPYADIHWRLTQEGAIEAKWLKDGTPLNLQPDAAITTAVTNFWTNSTYADYASAIHQMSMHFQVPCELLIASCLCESGALRALYPEMSRALRFEPYLESAIIKRRDPNKSEREQPANQFQSDQDLIEAPAGNADGDEYKRLRDLYNQTIPAAGKGGLRVPAGLDLTSTLLVAGGPMQWGQMLRFIQISKYIRTRISVGVMQALLNTAMGLTNNGPTLYRKINYGANPNPPTPDTSWLSFFGVDQPPPSSSPEKYLTEWLVNPRNAIFVGAHHAREVYNTIRTTYWDPVKIVACFNAGSLRDSSKSLWGFVVIDTYIEKMWAPAYNAAVNFFNQSPLVSPRPSVRMRG